MNRRLKTAARVAALLSGFLPVGTTAGADACPPTRAVNELAVETPAQSDPYARGMLWEIKPPNAPASYLFGTIHLPGITRLPPQVALALVKAARYVAETVLDRAAMTYYQQHMFSRDPPNLGSLFEQPFRERLLDLLAHYGFEQEMALRLKPWAAFTLLSRPKPTGAPTLDQALEGMARQRGIPVHGLVPVEELVAALENLPLDHQREVVIDTVCNRELIERQAQELAAMYLDQNLAGMMSVSRRFEPQEKAVAQTFTRRILNGRNRKMLKRLRPYLQQGNVFVAVGALHLPGEEGLLRGLAARGYRVTAVF